MKGLMRNIFGATPASEAAADRSEQKVPGQPQGPGEGGEGADLQYNPAQIEGSKEENKNSEFTTSSGFNLPGLSVNQSHIQPSSTTTASTTLEKIQPADGDQTRSLAQSQVVAPSNQLPGLFAGMLFNQPGEGTAPRDGGQEAGGQDGVQQQTPSNSMPGLFAGMGQSVTAAAADTPGEGAKNKSKEAASNDAPGPSAPTASAFDFFNQTDSTQQNNHTSKEETKTQNSRIALNPPQYPGGSVEKQENSASHSAFATIFAGLDGSSQANFQSNEKAANGNMQSQNPPSAFDFMAGIEPQNAIQPASNMQTTTKFNEENPAENLPSGLAGLGLFAGMDLMAGQSNTNGQIDRIGKQATADTNGNQQPTEISIIDNMNGDNSKNQISFEEMNLNMVGMSSPENNGNQNQQDIYQPPTLLSMPDDIQRTTSKQEPQRQTSLFAFMSVKQADGINQFHMPTAADILPSHHTQLQSNEQLSAHDRDNEPFNAQDIDREDLLMMTKQGGDFLSNTLLSAYSDDQENFEEILENREIIEDKIFAIKCRIIDFTVKQWDVSDKIKALFSDIEILTQKMDETQNEQAQAIEAEDYEKADNLDMRIKQTKKLVEAKEYQIKQMRENKLSQEMMKADKHQELSELMHRSIGKVEAIKDKQVVEMTMYQEVEVAVIEERKKRVHYESIRVSEENKVLEVEKSKAEASLAKVDDQVYQDTKEQHAEKHKLDEMIDDLSREVEELMRVLERKKKEKEMLKLEKQVHERKIEQARMMYKDELVTMETKFDKVNKKLNVNERQNNELQQEIQDLGEYERCFNGSISNFEQELKKLDEMKDYLELNSVEIDQCNLERKEIRTRQNNIQSQQQQLMQDKKQIEQGREFIQGRLSRLELELDEFESQAQAHVKKLIKLDLEKKKFAAAKKFKDAGKCQSEIKEIQQQQEHCTQQIEKTQDHKQQIENDLEAQDSQMADLEIKLSEISTDNAKTQLIVLTYRKDEILDLIGSINKVLEQSPNKDTSLQKRKSKSTPADLEAKRDKLQNELTSIDDELFELEKKYGEYKRPEIKKKEVPVAAPVQEVEEEEEVEVAEGQEDDEAEEEEDDESHGHDVAGLLKEEDGQGDGEGKPEENNGGAGDGIPEIDAETLRRFIQEYEHKLKDLEETIDREAEAENYDEAERLQEDLEEYQQQNEEKVSSYKQKLQALEQNPAQATEEDADDTSKEIDQPTKDDDIEQKPNELDGAEEQKSPKSSSSSSSSNPSLQQQNKPSSSSSGAQPPAEAEKEIEHKSDQEFQDLGAAAVADDLPDQFSEPSDSGEGVEAKPSAFGFMAAEAVVAEAPGEEVKVEDDEKPSVQPAQEDVKEQRNDTEEDDDAKDHQQSSAFGFMAQTSGQAEAPVEAPASDAGDLQNTKLQQYDFELPEKEEDQNIEILQQDKKAEPAQRSHLKGQNSGMSVHSISSDIVQNLVDEDTQDNDQIEETKEQEILDQVDAAIPQKHGNQQQESKLDDAENGTTIMASDNGGSSTKAEEAPKDPAAAEYTPPSGFSFMQASPSPAAAASSSGLQEQQIPEDANKDTQEVAKEEAKEELQSAATDEEEVQQRSGFGFMN